MAKKKTLTKTYESLPKIAKILIQLIFGALVGGIYRMVKYFESGNVVTLVVGILTTFTGIGNVIVWIVDLVTEILHDKIWVLAD